jgi:ureidoglycolate hydrolase
MYKSYTPFGTIIQSKQAAAVCASRDRRNHTCHLIKPEKKMKKKILAMFSNAEKKQ